MVDRICVIGSELNGKMRGFKRKRACLGQSLQRLKDAVKPLEESIADYCSAIIFIALQKDCVKALSASGP